MLPEGFFPCAADARLGVADHSGLAFEHAGGNQRTDGQVSGGRVAAGIRDEAGDLRYGSKILRQPVDGFFEQVGAIVLHLVPAVVVVDGAQAKGPAEIDHLDAGVERGRNQFQGNFVRRGEKHQLDPVFPQVFRRPGHARGVIGPMRPLVGRLGAVFEQNRLDRGVPPQNLDQFRPAIAGKANYADSNRFRHRGSIDLEALMIVDYSEPRQAA